MNPVPVKHAREKDPPRLKVLYIAGNGRSGSTLLDSILGQLAGFFAVGEVRQIWDEGIVENRLCGCGMPVQECEVWREVLDHLGMQEPLDDGRHIGRLREQLAQTKQLIPMFVAPDRYRCRTVTGLEEFLDATSKLYKAIAQVTHCEIIVDSSKWPTYSFLLDLLPDIDVYVLHLVRDPRACAFSWTRGKETEPGKSIGTQSTLRSTAYWVVWNPAIRYLWSRRTNRYRFLRYEDFVENPRQTIQSIVDFVGSPASQLPFSDDQTVIMVKTHAISGNPTRFAKGAVRLALDDEWHNKMPTGRRRLVTTMTWPLLWQYGYLSKSRS